MDYLPGVGDGAGILQMDVGGLARGVDQGQEFFKISFLQSLCLLNCPAVVVVEVKGPEDCSIPTAYPQGRNCRFELGFRYVYPDKLVMAFFYSDDRRELPFEETVRFIDNQQRIGALLDGQYDPDCVSADTLGSLVGDDGEEKPDFFP